MSKQTGQKYEKPKYHHPPNLLRQRVGYGGLPDELLQKAEAFIQDNQYDFKPTAIRLLDQFKAELEKAKKAKKKDKKIINEMTKPIMELKANGEMFRYSLLTEIAEILMNFLENIPSLDDDALHVIDAHRDTLDVIVKNDLAGSGGGEGHALSKELYAACNRYYKKHEISPTG